MKKLNILLGGLALGAMVAFLPSVGKASIIGSPHDFSSTGAVNDTNSWNLMSIATFGHGTSSYQNPCQVCHIPHGAAAYSAANGPLWNHAVATNATSQYITYDQAGSATFNALGLGSLTLGSSVACLSCHDGSIAVNQSYGSTKFNGNNGVATNVPSWAIKTYNPATGGFTAGGTYLTRMHPIGVVYSSAAAADPDLNPVASLPYSRMLRPPNGTVECSSCHDIHRTIGASATATDLLIVDVNNAQLCLTCHNK
jgi:predicted CXXCH cytochrome family protein